MMDYTNILVNVKMTVYMFDHSSFLYVKHNLIFYYRFFFILDKQLYKDKYAVTEVNDKNTDL